MFHCVYVPQLSYPVICWWTSRLLLCPGCCKQCCDEHWGTRVPPPFFAWLTLIGSLTLTAPLGSLLSLAGGLPPRLPRWSPPLTVAIPAAVVGCAQCVVPLCRQHWAHTLPGGGSGHMSMERVSWGGQTVSPTPALQQGGPLGWPPPGGQGSGLGHLRIPRAHSS